MTRDEYDELMADHARRIRATAHLGPSLFSKVRVAAMYPECDWAQEYLTAQIDGSDKGAPDGSTL